MYRRLSLLIAVGVIISTVMLSSCSKKDDANATSGSESKSVSQSDGSTASSNSSGVSSASPGSAGSSSNSTSTASSYASKAAASSSAGTASKSQSSAAAVSNGSMLSVKDITAESGETISVPFSINAGSEIAAADVMVYFDSSVLSYDSYTACTAFTSGGIHAANELSPGQLKLTFATLNPLVTADDMFTVKFKVKGKSGSKTNITPKFETCCKEDTVTKLNIAVDAGSVTVK